MSPNFQNDKHDHNVRSLHQWLSNWGPQPPGGSPDGAGRGLERFFFFFINCQPLNYDVHKKLEILINELNYTQRVKLKRHQAETSVDILVHRSVSHTPKPKTT